MLHNVFRFYYQSLSGFEKNIYIKLYSGFKDFSNNISLPKCNSALLEKIFNYVLYDNPGLFYVSFWYNWTSDSNVTFFPVYRYSRAEVEKINVRITQKCEKILNIIQKHSPLVAVKYIHDSLISFVSYAECSKESQYLTGVFLHNKAVCAGISKSVKHLMDQIGIPCVYIVGESNLNMNAVAEPHAWNGVYINDEWYHLDVTFDLTLSHQCGFLRYDYLNLSLEEIKKDHNIQYGCVGGRRSLAYYNYDLTLNKLEDIRNIISSAIAKGKNNCVFKFISNMPPIEEGYVLEYALKEATAYGYSLVKLYFNESQCIYALTWIR